MRKVLYITAALLFVAACTQETNVVLNEEGEIQTLTVVGPAPIQFEPITGSLSTKGTSVQDGNALLFNWAVGDTLGIFPNQGNQVEFPISVANGTTSASFDGGGWALRNNASYAAYYPFSVWNYHRDNETILLDYSGQVQDGNGSFAHLSAYDYLASNKTTPLNSSVTFQMDRQGSILYIDIVVPEPETITALEVSCDEAIFTEKASLDISGNTPVVTPVEMTKTLRLEFVNTATTSNNETVRGYLAVQPVDFSAKTVTATLYTATGSYEAPVTSRVVNKGRAAFLRFSDDFTPVNIEFADAEVKRICVENWDTNGDGELSYKEAAAVTDLGRAFRGSSSFTSFNELQYFTGLTQINSENFETFNSMVSIVLPESIVEINEYSFDYNVLTTINIPKNVRFIHPNAFYLNSFTEITVDKDNQYYCSEDGVLFDKTKETLVCYPNKKNAVAYSIPDGVKTIGSVSCYGADFVEVFFPETVQTIEDNAFRCSSLKYIHLPQSLREIQADAFGYCGSLEYITIPAGVVSIPSAIRYPMNFKGFIVESGNMSFMAVDGVLFNYELTTLINYATGLSGEYVIPEGVTEIAASAFQQSDVSSIIFPSSLRRIGSASFTTCTNLTSITIPDGVIEIAWCAFSGCQSLTMVTVNNPTPPVMSNAFRDTNNCPIYVPNESVAAYKAAPGWSEYADRIFGIDVDGSVVGPDPQNPD